MTRTLDHLGFGVADYERARRFYDAVLAPLGITRIAETGPADGNAVRAAGYGRDGDPAFWIGADGRTAPVLHVAFRALDRASVDRFHAAALAAGGSDHGAPGPRPHYGPNYYAAFIRDLDGHNIEAVCHEPV